MKKIIIFTTCLFFSISLIAQEKIKADDLEKVISNPQNQILDVRTPGEYKEGHIPNSINVNWQDKENFKNNVLSKLNKKEPIYVYCLGGGRSKQASQFLIENGFKVYDYSGGMMDWRNNEKPEIKPEKDDSKKSLSLEDFDHLIKSADVVLINYSAVWCGPCQELKPTINKIEKEQGKKVKVIRIDADQNAALLKLKKINGIPKLTLYKAGREVWAHTGVTSEKTIVEQINKVVKK